MEDKIVEKLCEMKFEENENKKDLWGKPIPGCFLNWDFRKTSKGRFYVVLENDSFEKDKVSQQRPEYIEFREFQKGKTTEVKPEPSVFKPVDNNVKINLVFKDISPMKAIEILKHLN